MSSGQRVTEDQGVDVASRNGSQESSAQASSSGLLCDAVDELAMVAGRRR